MQYKSTSPRLVPTASVLFDIPCAGASRAHVAPSEPGHHRGEPSRSATRGGTCAVFAVLYPKRAFSKRNTAVRVSSPNPATAATTPPSAQKSISTTEPANASWSPRLNTPEPFVVLLVALLVLVSFLLPKDNLKLDLLTSDSFGTSL